jgi:hypothetical protein
LLSRFHSLPAPKCNHRTHALVILVVLAFLALLCVHNMQTSARNCWRAASKQSSARLRSTALWYTPSGTSKRLFRLLCAACFPQPKAKPSWLHVPSPRSAAMPAARLVTPLTRLFRRRATLLQSEHAFPHRNSLAGCALARCTLLHALCIRALPHSTIPTSALAAYHVVLH